MDDLIRQYAEILKNAKLGDYTYEGILSDFGSQVLKLAEQALDNVRTG